MKDYIVEKYKTNIIGWSVNENTRNKIKIHAIGGEILLTQNKIK